MSLFSLVLWLQFQSVSPQAFYCLLLLQLALASMIYLLQMTKHHRRTSVLHFAPSLMHSKVDFLVTRAPISGSRKDQLRNRGLSYSPANHIQNRGFLIRGKQIHLELE